VFAMPIVGRLSVLGRLRGREEDDALGVCGDLVEVADHHRAAPSGGLGRRHRRPHPQVELAAKLLHQPLVIVIELGIALGEQHVAVPGLHPDQLHEG